MAEPDASESVKPATLKKRLIVLAKRLILQAKKTWAVGIVGAVLGAVLTALLPPVFQHLMDMPVTGVAALMTQESEAGLSRDSTLVRQIYAVGATVTDAGCTTGRQATTWRGLDQIAARYEALPDFNYLDHYMAEFTWNSNYPWAVSLARATARSSGTTKETPPQLIAGAEQWTFTKVGGRWFITTFVYGLC